LLREALVDIQKAPNKWKCNPFPEKFVQVGFLKFFVGFRAFFDKDRM
jgi:hypothetical protein